MSKYYKENQILLKAYDEEYKSYMPNSYSGSCFNCGAELPAGAEICSYCGVATLLTSEQLFEKRQLEQRKEFEYKIEEKHNEPKKMRKYAVLGIVAALIAFFPIVSFVISEIMGW